MNKVIGYVVIAIISIILCIQKISESKTFDAFLWFIAFICWLLCIVNEYSNQKDKNLNK